MHSDAIRVAIELIKSYVERKQYNRLAEQKSENRHIQMHIHLWCGFTDTCWDPSFFREQELASLVCHCKCFQLDSTNCCLSAHLSSALYLSTPWLWKYVLLSDMLSLTSRLPRLSFFSSTSQPPGKAVCGSEMGCEWSPQQTPDRPYIPRIDILPSSFPTSISTVTFSHPLCHFSAWLAFHLWICMAG